MLVDEKGGGPYEVNFTMKSFHLSFISLFSALDG